jgi:hypothetical protein
MCVYRPAGEMRCIGCAISPLSDPPPFPRPPPLQVSHIHLPSKLIGLVEMLAEHAHESWAEIKMQAGWTYGKERNEAMKKHPMLVPYVYLLPPQPPPLLLLFARAVAVATIAAAPIAGAARATAAAFAAAAVSDVPVV